MAEEQNNQKVAIVTGAAQGIGKIISGCLLSHGYRVFLFDIDAQLGEQTTSEFKQRFGEKYATFIHCDVSSKIQFTEAFFNVVKSCGWISLMINNAGILNEYEYEQCILTNMIGVITGTNLAVEHMRTDSGGKGGIIVNMSSVAGFSPFYFLPTYCASKCGVLGFTRSWAENPKCESVSFMCICPEIIDTELFRKASEKCLDPVGFNESRQNFVFTEPDIVANSFWQLITDGTNGSVMKISSSGAEYLQNPPIAGIKQHDYV